MKEIFQFPEFTGVQTSDYIIAQRSRTVGGKVSIQKLAEILEATGPQGPQGPQGATGTGTQGPQGDPGAQGPQGATGNSGAAGLSLVANLSNSVSTGTGTKVFAGSLEPIPEGTYVQVVDESGTRRMWGTIATTGVLEVTLTATAFSGSGSASIWTAYPAGAAGATGATGAQGPQGAQGSTGAAGAQGPQGAAGAQGATGATGPQGPQGAQGSTGAQGATGAQGSQGANSAYIYNRTASPEPASGAFFLGLVDLSTPVTTFASAQSVIIHKTALGNINMSGLSLGAPLYLTIDNTEGIWAIFKLNNLFTSGNLYESNSITLISSAGLFEDIETCQISVLQQGPQGAAGSLSGLTENTLQKANAGGNGLQDSGIVDDGSDIAFSNRSLKAFSGETVIVSTDTLTLSNTDHNGRVLIFTHASGCAITCGDSLPVGFNCSLISRTAGTVGLETTGGATVENFENHAELAGNKAWASLYVASNSGSNAIYMFGGQTA